MDGKLINISINVSKITKDRLYPGKNGAQYCSLDVWVNDEEDQYGKDVSVSESLTKEEREAKTPRNYVGNGKKLLGWDRSADDATPSDDQSLPF